MSAEYVKLGMFIAKKIELGHLINDNAPDSIAAGIVYFLSQLCKLAYNKNDIKNICGVSEVTINKCYKKIDTMRDIVVPAVILQKYA
jgi:transcription initiation factor TFIIIB Brf1 subunit/transcription initiation factor TFIIB